MEYVFRNSLRQGQTTISLNAFAATIFDGTREEYIPYANVTGVRLSRYSKKLYKIHLYQDGLDPIVITNKNYDAAGKSVYQVQAYQQFVQELHRHLSSRSSAEYTSGSSLNKMLFWGVVFMVLSFTISFTADFLGLGLMNAYVQGLMVWVLSLIVMAIFSFGSFPKSYLPTNIPVQFLP